MFGIVANVMSDHAFRTGAKVWISYCNGDAEHPIAHGLDKRGRFIRKHTHYKRLTNYRAAWIPEHLRDTVVWQYEKKEDAAAGADLLNKKWEGIRYYHPDGTLLKDGLPQDYAHRRHMRMLRINGVQNGE